MERVAPTRWAAPQRKKRLVVKSLHLERHGLGTELAISGFCQSP